MSGTKKRPGEVICEIRDLIKSSTALGAERIARKGSHIVVKLAGDETYVVSVKHVNKSKSEPDSV